MSPILTFESQFLSTLLSFKVSTTTRTGWSRLLFPTDIYRSEAEVGDRSIPQSQRYEISRIRPEMSVSQMFLF